MYEIQQDQKSDYLERTDYYILCIKFVDDDDDDWPGPGRSYKQSWCSVCTAWHPHWFINQELGGVRSHINISPTL